MILSEVFFGSSALPSRAVEIPLRHGSRITRGRDPRGFRNDVAFTLIAAIFYFGIAPKMATASPGETPHLVFVKEYIRELSNYEDIHEQNAEELLHAGGNAQEKLLAGIRASTRIIISTNLNIKMLSETRLGGKFDWFVQNLIENDRSIIREYEGLNESGADLLSGRVKADNIGDMLAALAKTEVRIDGYNKLFYQPGSIIAFYALLDDRRLDKNGNVTRLIITKKEREELIADIRSRFGKKLDQDTQDYFVSAAGLLLFGLQKDSYLSADDPR